VGIVWILGAGFSKPLGGPLLGKLLSPEAEQDLRVRYPEGRLWDKYATAARFLYQYGRSGKKYAVKIPNGGATEGEDLWDDAEQYLDYLDTTAERTGPGRARLLEILRNEKFGLGLEDTGAATLKSVAASGRRLLAAECCAFLEGADPATERWSPYRRWLRDLVSRREDTIVTFNYDMVPEMIAAATEVKFAYKTARGILGILPVLKLHGSVNWTLQWDARAQVNNVIEQGTQRAALVCDDLELAIAGPGPSKQSLSRGAFNTYWLEALEALKHATAIVFLGYRFPPTDAEARERLLGAIRDNREGPLAVHIVLGQDPGTSAARLKALLNHALSWRRGQFKTYPYALVQHPMGAEDLLSVIERGSILAPDELSEVVR